MPRPMPRYDNSLHRQTQLVQGIITIAETAHSAGDKRWSRDRLEALYELAFLRLFAGWEWCLEAILYRSMCGYASRAGRESVKAGSFFRTVADAETEVLRVASAGKPKQFTYLLWHNCWQVMSRCQDHICSYQQGMSYIGQQERVLSSCAARLNDFANVRHRIAHDHNDAKTKFDNSTKALANNKVYPLSRPGKFLRDWDSSVSPRRRWLDTATMELIGLIGQMV